MRPTMINIKIIKLKLKFTEIHIQRNFLKNNAYYCIFCQNSDISLNLILEVNILRYLCAVQ